MVLWTQVQDALAYNLQTYQKQWKYYDWYYRTVNKNWHPVFSPGPETRGLLKIENSDSTFCDTVPLKACAAVYKEWVLTPRGYEWLVGVKEIY